MSPDYSSKELLEFLNHAADRGLIPGATARALAVASRSILDILNEEERTDLRRLDVGVVVKRFTNKRARDFNPASLKEYSRRFQRAVDLFVQWRDDPAAFSVPVRVTHSARKKMRPISESGPPTPTASAASTLSPQGDDLTGYQSSFPVRTGVIVTIVNIPTDLTKAEAERLAHFVRLLPLG